MVRKRRQFSGAFKAKVALSAVRGDMTTAQLAAKFGVHENPVSAWKKQLLAGAAELFADITYVPMHQGYLYLAH